MAPFSHPFLAFLLLILRICPLVYSLNDSIEKTASLFEPQDSIYRVGPSAFPKPTHLFPDSQHVVPVVPPIIGQHRPDKNTVFAYAEGYPVENYVLFISTLRATGFDGDIVLAIADEPKEYVVEYLSSQQHVVVYKASLACFDEDRLTPAPRTEKNGGIFQMCQLNGVYGSITSEDNTTILQDPRAGRVVATLRYEWYWIWAMKYLAESWILLLDARDSLFQTNPFTPDLPQSSTHGILYFFGESHEATRLGKSKKNVNWLRNAYGTTVLEALTEKPTICSGSTMGNQRAIETYLRAMVNEWDETDIAMTGADQGFHNYLYYSSKLMNAVNISTLTVWEQGKGIVNNLGALRTKPLSEWGIYNTTTHQVFNWDKTTLSPVVHQWDRDQHLFRYTQNQRMKQMVQEWKNTLKREQ